MPFWQTWNNPYLDPNFYNQAMRAATNQQQIQQGQPTAINTLIKVDNIEAAKNYKIPNNSTMPLFDANEDIFYVKTTDGSGNSTFRAFKFEEIDMSPPEYVTTAQLNTQLNNFMDEIRGMLTNGKFTIRENEQSNHIQPAGEPTE